MADLLLCPKCHQEIHSSDYFCHSCGKVLRTPPLSTTLLAQLWLYFKALLLPPLGIIWGLRYFRQKDTASKIVGTIVIVITIVEIIWAIQATVYTVNTVNSQIYQQMKLYGL